MLLPNCPCCGTRCGDNPCCTEYALPCQLTIEYTGDGTWNSTGGMAAGDLAALESFALQTWVGEQTLFQGFSVNNGGIGARLDVTSPWQGWFRLVDAASPAPTRNSALANVDGVAGCYAVCITGNPLLTAQNNIQAGSFAVGSTLSVALPSGNTLTGAALGIVPETSNWLMPFRYGSWCGQTSFTYEFRQPRNTAVPGQGGLFSAGWQFRVVTPDDVLILATLRGGKVRFSW